VVVNVVVLPPTGAIVDPPPFFFSFFHSVLCKVAQGSAGRYFFSYETAVGNCLLVRASPGTYGVWVHWALVAQADNTVVNYINGAPNAGVTCVCFPASIVYSIFTTTHAQSFTPSPNPYLLRWLHSYSLIPCPLVDSAHTHHSPPRTPTRTRSRTLSSVVCVYLHQVRRDVVWNPERVTGAWPRSG
jgi:hypothetical protein